MRLQKSHKEWVERKHLEDQPSTSSSANVSTSDDILLPSTSVEVLEGDTSTLEKRMSLIRDVIGDKAMQIKHKSPHRRSARGKQLMTTMLQESFSVVLGWISS